jgi:hypothetical protein
VCRKPTIFDAVSRLVPPPRHVCERQELLASDALTLARRHGVTAGEGLSASFLQANVLSESPAPLTFASGLVASNIAKLCWTPDQLALTRFLLFGRLGFVGFPFDCLSGESCSFLCHRFARRPIALASGKGKIHQLTDCLRASERAFLPLNQSSQLTALDRWIVLKIRNDSERASQPAVRACCEPWRPFSLVALVDF